jgi:chitin synthase
MLSYSLPYLLLVSYSLLETLFWNIATAYSFFQLTQQYPQRSILSLILSSSLFCWRLLCWLLIILTLPLPFDLTGPEWLGSGAVTGLIVIAFLLYIPSVIGTLGNAIKQKRSLIDGSKGRVFVLMPVWNEPVDILWEAVESIQRLKHPNVHLFVSFDKNEMDENVEGFVLRIKQVGSVVGERSYQWGSLLLTYSLFPHAGKRMTQKATYDLIQSWYPQVEDTDYILLIDSDMLLDPNCIGYFLAEEKKALTGFIGCRGFSLGAIYQDAEYLHSQFIDRGGEAFFGAVTCLPGAFTFIQRQVFTLVAGEYFSSGAYQSHWDYWRRYLGEDKWLTSLLMQHLKPGDIGMCTRALAQTQPVSSLLALMKQRRRWILGFLGVDTAMITTPDLWRRYPLVLSLDYLRGALRSTFLGLAFMIIAFVTEWRGISAMTLFLLYFTTYYIFALWLSLYLRRPSLALVYPLVFAVNPLLNSLYLLYGLVTATRRTWGGPRAK